MIYLFNSTLSLQVTLDMKQMQDLYISTQFEISRLFKLGFVSVPSPYDDILLQPSFSLLLCG